MLQDYQVLYLDNDIPINRSFYCNNGDIRTRGLEVHVLDNSMAKDCTGLSIKTIIRVPSGEMFEATVANGLVTVLNAATGIYQILFPNNMGKGRLIAEIQLSNTVPEVIVSRKFSILGDGSLTSDGQINALPGAGLLYPIIAAEPGRVTAEIARALAESGRNTAETTRASFYAGFNSSLAAVTNRVDDIITTPVPTGEVIAQEIIDARQGEGSIGANIALRTNKSYVDTLISSVVSGAPKTDYATLALLQAGVPLGNTSVYLTTDGNWNRWNGTAWVVGGVYQGISSSDFPATNMIANGNFSDGSTGFRVNNSINTVAANVLTNTNENTVSSPSVYTLINKPVTVSSKWFVACKARAISSVCSEIQWNFESTFIKIQPMPEINVWYAMYGTITVPDAAGNQGLYLKHVYPDVATASGKAVEMKEFIAIDLTATFGTGNEPTNTEMNNFLTEYPNSWFDGTKSPFVTSRKLFNYQRASEIQFSEVDTRLALIEDIGKNVIYKQPMPPKVTPTMVTVQYNLKAMDKDGVLWSTDASNTVSKSSDNGISWTPVLTVDGATYGGINDYGLLVTDTGRLLMGTVNHNVLVSSLDKTTYAIAFTFSDDGKFSIHLGHKQYQNLCFIGGYDGLECKEVYMSKDGGGTWSKIYTATVIDPLENCHIHTIEYDPWDNRIYIMVGDTKNRNLVYSDDMGLTCVKVFTDSEYTHPNNLQSTVIIAYEHGIIFATDSGVDHCGLYYLPKKGLNQAIQPNDFIIDYYPVPNGASNNPSTFAVAGAIIRSPELQLTLMPFYSMRTTGFSRILASENGRKWFEIWRDDEILNQGLLGIYGPAISDSQRRAYGFFRDITGVKSFEIKIPLFV